MADFSKIFLNEDQKTALTDLEPQYMTFIQKKMLGPTNLFFGYFSLLKNNDF